MIANRLGVLVFSMVAAFTGPAGVVEPSSTLGFDPNAIERAAGTRVTVTADGVARIAWLRDDVSVTIDGAPFRPKTGLGSWAAFAAMPTGGSMVTGDTVVFEDEISPAMDAAFAHGLRVTALHNHFVFDRPPVFFMHIGGVGDEVKLATGVRAVWDAIRRVRRADPQPQSTFGGDAPDQSGAFDVAALGRVLGGQPTVNNGVVKFTFGRRASMRGMEFGASMGLASWAAFSGGQGNAIVDGVIAMTAEEVQPVMRSLRSSGIHIVALHNHMIGENPSYYFLHYWGKGKAEDLARGLRAAMDVQVAGAAPQAAASAESWEYTLRELPWFQNDENAQAKCLAWLEDVGSQGWIVPDLAIGQYGVVVGLVPIAIYDPNAVDGFDWGRTVSMRRLKE